MTTFSRRTVAGNPVSTSAEKPPTNDCCVCLESTITKTICGHWLCKDCRQKLPRAVCPLCRRSLVGVLQAHGTGLWMHNAARYHNAPMSLRPLLLRFERARFRTLSDALHCAAELRDSLPEYWSEVYEIPRRALNSAVAHLVTTASLTELSSLAQSLSTLLNQEILMPVDVLPSVRRVVRRAADQVFDARESAWQDLKNNVEDLLTISELEIFQSFVAGVAKKVAAQFVAVVKLTFMATPAIDFVHGSSCLDAWPAAHREANGAMREVVQQRLLLHARRLSSAVGKAVVQEARWASVFRFLIEGMSAAAICDVLDQASATAVCDALVPVLMRIGVQTMEMPAPSNIDSGQALARQLASKLIETPELVHYDSDNTFLFDRKSSLFDSPRSQGLATPTFVSVTSHSRENVSMRGFTSRASSFGRVVDRRLNDDASRNCRNFEHVLQAMSKNRESAEQFLRQHHTKEKKELLQPIRRPGEARPGSATQNAQ